MGKRIKIGLDKTPAPVTKTFQQLVDNEGTLLFDDAGNPLVTEESAALTSRTLSDESLSVHVNNEATEIGGGAIPVLEQFKEISEVSSSLLGVARAEEQLSLFSDVATYGLDVDNWDASDIYASHGNEPKEWYSKENPVFGRRSNVKFYEGSDQQALYLKAFPSQWSFPFGTRYEKRSVPTIAFKKYMNFIALGIYLHDFFVSQGQFEFARLNFLNKDDVRIVNFNGGPLSEESYEFNRSQQVATVIFNGYGSGGNDGFFDVEYVGSDEQLIYDSIERWTVFWDRIRSGTDVYPTVNALANEDPLRVAESGYKGFREYAKIRNFCQDGDTIPGKAREAGYGGDEYYGILQSKRTFRYQPGRVSGFTFGSRMIAGGSSTIAEWGCSNDTDEYMFQLKGDRLAIVRRSTIKMPDELLQRQGLDPSKQTEVAIPGIKNESRPKLWETLIERTSFTGDPLDGSGKSKYALSFEDVTMYKIEFSWYGAIGAKFYAYIPVGNGDCRWVLMHTFVIENGLGQPILENPDFRFKYLLYTNFTEDIKEPIYLYKYGSSCYIDGGDEGTIRLSSKSMDPKSFSNKTPIMGIMPKDYISNSVGDSRINFKKIYPSTISISSDTACRIDFKEIRGTSQGVHFNYSPSIHMNGRHPKNRDLIGKYATSADGSTDGSPNFISLVQNTESSTNEILANSFRRENRFLDIFGNLITTSNIFKVNTTENSDVISIVAGGIVNRAESFDGLQIGDSLTINGQSVVVKHFRNGSSDAYTSSSTTDTVVLTTPMTTTSANTDASLQYVFNADENMSHIIGDGIYGSYVDTIEENGRLYGRGRDTNAEPPLPHYSLIERLATNSRTVNNSNVRPATSGTFIPVRLSGYRTIVASKTPIYSNKFKIHFLNPEVKDKGLRYSDPNYYFEKHFAEFCVGVTPYQPTESGSSVRPSSLNDNPEVLFNSSRTTNEDFDYVEYDRDLFPSIEYCHANRQFDQLAKLETKEQDTLYGNRLEIDPRINKAENRIQGEDRGKPSTVLCEVVVEDYTYNQAVNDVYNGRSVTRIDFDTTNRVPSENSITPGESEVGLNFTGTNLFYQSNLIIKSEEDQVIDDNGNLIYACIYIDRGLTSTLQNAEEKIIQTKNIILSDDWKAYAVDKNGNVLFDHKRFNVRRAAGFDVQPLYPVFALGDYARVNGIVIEEILEQGIVKVHTPDLITEDSVLNPGISIVNSGGSNKLNPPSAFNSNTPLESSRYDISNLNPLRPGLDIYSCYVGEDETVQVDLENVFGRDRKGITRGSLNNRAMFITATALVDGAIGNVQVSITSKEQ